MSDANKVLVDREELRLLRQVAETSSDLVFGRSNAKFTEFCGGPGALQKTHEEAVRELHKWRRAFYLNDDNWINKTKASE